VLSTITEITARHSAKAQNYKGVRAATAAYRPKAYNPNGEEPKMSRKNNLLRFKALTGGVMTGTTVLTSAVCGIRWLDNVGIQLTWTGTAVGTFQVQVSANHDEDEQGNVRTAGNWVALDLGSPGPVASGTASSIYIDLTQLSAPFIRVVYTNTSSTGALSVVMTGKML
jgi:hypothetical protein